MNTTSQLLVVGHDSLHPAVNTSRLSLVGRQSLLLHWTVGKRVYEAEASPLEGFGEDSLALCRQSLATLDAELLEETARAVCEAADPCLTLARAGGDLLSPSARFAFEACVLERAADRLGTTVWQLLRSSPGAEVTPPPEFLPSSAVFDPLVLEPLTRAAQLMERGVRTLKLKTGRDLQQELACLEALRARFPGVFRFRVDPNQTWTSSEIAELCGLDTSDIDWLEDPAEEATSWRELKSPLPLAADEILIGEEPSVEFLDLLGARVVVLKPMALGGYTTALAWARVARESGRTVNVSHLFDGPRALDATIQLAFAAQSAGVTPGLGLHEGLEGWNLTPRWARADRLLRPTASVDEP